ncbi:MULTISPECIES: MFS transporter [unclassified Streptomyces]|uniref:MFS transporter n=1 Tax=unclassified Streptomyces TaxID=2593676 RepID=UPI0007001888|nr:MULTISPECIES: MFS transporter [unclassified Streptomyces]KQX53489.1 MFS transporter [Streptomyces sp. Root1304]KRA90407.1 MFS transporter [Streptomyces sp. Root66D1]
MYLATTGRRGAPPAPSGVRRRVPGTVLALGAVSLVTDVSSEMVTAVLPLYLVLGLGLSPLQFGLLDGLSTGATALVRLLGGATADRGGRHKQIGGLGYALSACSRLGLLLAGGATGWIAGAITADRLGKGVRTAPRDALITLHSPPEDLGRAFGTHRAMDTTGALLGPLAAFALLWATADAYDAVFAVSFCVGAFGVLLWVLLVPGRNREAGNGGARNREARDAGPREGRGVRPDMDGGARPDAQAPPRARGGLLAGLRSPAYRRIVLCAGLLGAATVGDSFLYLLLQRRLDFDATWFPFLPLGAAAVYLLLAVPAGRLADRVGRRGPLLYGHGALLLAYGLLLAPLPDPVVLLGVLALLGVFYATTDGVLMALTGPFLTEGRQAGGLALVQTAQALARLGAAVAFGAVWTASGPETALVVALLALAVAVGCSARLLPRGLPAPSGHPVPEPSERTD